MALSTGLSLGLSPGLLVGLNPSAIAPAVATVLADAGSTTDGTSFATASITPLANQVIYAAVTAFSAVSLLAPTCSGNGLTWVQVETIALDLNRQLTVFRAQGASPSAGVVTFDFGAVIQTSARWAIIQYAGADASGTDGSGATPQSDTAQAASGTSLSVNLPGPLAGPASRMLVFVATASTAVTSDAQFTRLTEGTIGANTQRLESEHAPGEVQCTVTQSTQAIAMVALEVKAA
jgi:hypothetical protein